MTGFRPRTVSPSRVREFLLDFLPPERRRLRTTGIHIFGLRYWADWLCTEVADNRGYVDLRYDPRDISSIFVRDSAGVWQEVHLFKPRGSFGLREHQAARDETRRSARGTWDEEAVHRTREARRTMLEEASRKTAQARRRLEAADRAIEVRAAVLAPPVPTTPGEECREREDPAAFEVGADDVEVW